MKPITLRLALAACLCLVSPNRVPSQNAGAEPARVPPIAVYFNPGGGATAAIVKEVAAAEASILVQAYSFNSSSIAKALVAARERGVKVSVILDKTKVFEEKDSQAGLLVRHGISTLVDGNHRAAHNKVMVLDDRVVISGSFNFTKHSERDNAENLLVIRDRALAEKYAANWKLHAEHSQPYEPGRASTPPQ